ncbi:MAG: M28 family peptidase [bacterium]|nr:M28 family peptidase [bacterium]
MDSGNRYTNSHDKDLNLDLELLNQLTDLGEKKAGTKAGKQAQKHISQYVKNTFPEAAVSKESFSVTSVKKSEASLIANGKNSPAHLYDNTGVEGSFVEAELYLAGRRISTKDKPLVKGKIVVFYHNVLFHRIFQVISAYEAGAVGVILVSKSGEYIQKGIGYPYMLGHCPIPAVGITIDVWKSYQASSVKRVRLDYSTKLGKFTAGNIIADFGKKSTGTAVENDTIVIGAHFDSWDIGTHDNGIAVQLLVDILKKIYIEDKKKLNKSIRAIFFDAEEIGLLGSGHHAAVNNLDQYAFYMNLEMPVPTYAGGLKTISYSGHSLAKKSISAFKLLLKGIFPVPLNLFYRFSPVFPADIHAFYIKDIPCMTTFCRNPHIHTPLDTLENIKLDQYNTMRDLLVDIIYAVDKTETRQEQGSRSTAQGKKGKIKGIKE